MASRVNTRFVTFLAIGLMLLGGGAMVAVYFALKKSGADYAALGDKNMADGHFEKAAEFYSKAVYRERTNAKWIEKWLEAMGKTTPTPRIAYLDKYSKEYVPALKGYADALPEDVDAQKRFLDEQFQRMRMTSGGSVEPWNDFIVEVEESMKRFATPDGPVRELRRYRAFANIIKIPFVTAEKRAEMIGPIEEDLTAAVAANPADDEAVAELANIKMVAAGAARDANDNARADHLEQEAQDLLAASLKDHGPSSRVLWRRLQIDFLKAARDAQVRNVSMSRAQLYDDKNPQFVELIDAIKAEPKEKIDVLQLSQICSEAARSKLIGNAGVLDLLYTLEAKDPALINLKILIGRFENLSQHYDKAVAAYQRVIDAPDLPLSFDGWILYDQRAEAYRQQIMAKLTEREVIQKKIEDLKEAAGVRPEDAERLLSEAKDLRRKLAEYVGESDRQLLYVDARIAYAEKNYDAARINLDRYNERSSDQDVGAMLLFGSIMADLRNTGSARSAFQKVLARDPDNTQALLRLADLEQGEQNFAAAVSCLEDLKKLYPTSSEIEERYNRVKQLQLAKEGGNVTDKVVVATNTAFQMIKGLNPDYAGAAVVLKKALDDTNELTLYPILARVLQADGQIDAATAVVNEGLVKAPGNPTLTRLLEILKIKDPLEASLKAIDQDESSTPLQKHIWRQLAYTQFKKTDEAKKELDEAAKLEPENPVVLELKLQEAVQGKDMDEARRIADTAARTNADHVGGLTFKAQIEIAEKRYPDAIASLEAALEKDRNNVPIWRQLGALRMETQKPEAAATAFDRALAIRPGDIPSMKGYMRAKIRLGQSDEALQFARKNQDVGVQDMEFVDMWLALEAATAGGDRSKALDARQQLAKRFPDNERNNVALVLLLLDAQRYSDARSMIDKLRGSSDSPAYVELDIRWHIAQNDLRSAIDTFNRWVTTLPPEKNNEDPYIALAQIFIDYGKYDAAILSLDDGGRKHQNPKTMGADRKLGEVQFLTRRYKQAIETFDRVLAVDPNDPDFRINGQIVEAYVRMNRFADAKKRIDALGPAIESNGHMLLLKGEILAGFGQMDEAARTYDAAVAAAKNDPIAYIKRAEFLGRDPARLGDAEQDLKQALALSPRNLGARRLLTDLHMRRNEPDKAVAVLREGVSIDPDNDALRLDLVGLYLRLKQNPEAIALVEDALRRRTEDPSWLFRGREVMYALNRFDDAAGYAWRLWEKRKDVDAALAYLDAAFKMQKTDFVKAMQVLQTPSLNTPKDVRLLFARARLQLKRQRNQEASDDLTAALALIDQSNRVQAQGFMSGMGLIYDNPKDRLSALTGLRPKDGYKAWMAFFFANLKSSFPESTDEGVSELRALGESGSDLFLRKQAYVVVGSIFRAQKKYDEAVRWWKDGLKLDPADPELNNNVAYCLAEDIKKPDEALPFAEKAATSMPNNPSIQDTLGTIYMLLGTLDKAEDALELALSLVQAPEESSAVLLHLAQLRILQNKNDDAKNLLRRAEELLKTDQRLSDQYTPLLNELKGKLEAK